MLRFRYFGSHADEALKVASRDFKGQRAMSNPVHCRLVLCKSREDL